MQTNPVKATAAFDINELLEKAGARPRGNRHDCPKCGGCRTVSHSDQMFYCHRCQWKGNVVTLAKELGIRPQWLPRDVYLRQQKDRDHVKQMAEALTECVNGRSKTLAQAERILCRAELAAHDAGPSEWSWAVLAAVYESMPRVRAEWTFLSYAPAVAVMEFLAAPSEAEAGTVDAVLARGGVQDEAGRFVDVPV